MCHITCGLAEVLLAGQTFGVGFGDGATCGSVVTSSLFAAKTPTANTKYVLVIKLICFLYRRVSATLAGIRCRCHCRCKYDNTILSLHNHRWSIYQNTHEYAKLK